MNTTIIRDTPHNTMSASNQFARGAIIAGKKSERWNLHDETLDAPLRWRSPRHITNVIDLFHRDVPFEFIDRVFAVMALCPQHTFQILTKRPDRMAEYFAEPFKNRVMDWGNGPTPLYVSDAFNCDAERRIHEAGTRHADWLDVSVSQHDAAERAMLAPEWDRWPLPNVWLGTSCEDQAAADARIPHLLKCPAAVRFISAEPLLGPIDLTDIFTGTRTHDGGRKTGITWSAFRPHNSRGVDWVIVGGESGGGGRPCNVEWIRSIVRQCDAALVPCFVKQLGARPVHSVEEYDADAKPKRWTEIKLKGDPKGGDPAGWPEDLRVREWPAQKVGAA